MAKKVHKLEYGICPHCNKEITLEYLTGCPFCDPIKVELAVKLVDETHPYFMKEEDLLCLGHA